jgi:hypothetical protein
VGGLAGAPYGNVAYAYYRYGERVAFLYPFVVKEVPYLECQPIREQEYFAFE